MGKFNFLKTILAHGSGKVSHYPKKYKVLEEHVLAMRMEILGTSIKKNSKQRFGRLDFDGEEYTGSVCELSLVPGAIEIFG
jgi:hypothetical protein